MHMPVCPQSCLGSFDDRASRGAGAAQVVLTDRDPLALRCALRSARQSGLHSLAPRPVHLAESHLCPQQASMGGHGDSVLACQLAREAESCGQHRAAC